MERVVYEMGRITRTDPRSPTPDLPEPVPPSLERRGARDYGIARIPLTTDT